MELTGIWPPLPIIIKNTIEWPMAKDYDFDAAVTHRNHVCQIDLHLTSSQLQRLASVMQEQFPALIHLSLSTAIGILIPALPDGFLGGFAPHLQSLELYRIPFPAIPKLLLSATDLVYLTLWDIPRSGYISPEVVVTSLAVLANLKSLTIEYKYSDPRPDRRPPQPTRTILPALSRFEFGGPSEFLEDLVARVDAPLLDSIQIAFFHPLVPDIPQLALFMRRFPKFQALNKLHVDFDYYGVRVGSLPPTLAFDEGPGLRILCDEFNGRLSSLVGVLTSSFPSIYMVEHLYIYGPRIVPPKCQWYDTESIE
jgi:hypothetical protein